MREPRFPQEMTDKKLIPFLCVLYIKPTFKMSSPNVYVTFIEYCRKDSLIRMHYLQHNGNEEELTKFYKYVHQAVETGYELGGDLSSFDMNLDTLISEEAVDSHTKLNDNPYVRFFKLDGKFISPISEEYIDGTNSDELAYVLDEHLYRGQIRYYFKNTN